MDVFDLSAKLTLDRSEYESGLEDAKEKGSGLGTALTTAGKVAGTGILAVGTAVAGLTTSIAGGTAKLAEYGDNIDKSSQKLGVSSQFYQEWDAVLQHSGTSMDSMSATFKTLAQASQDASEDQQEAFKALGLSMDEVSNMSAEDLFTNVIYNLQSMEEGTERTTLATTLLGRGAMEMGALLNTSTADTKGMIDTVNELGGVLDENAVKSSAQFQDSLQDLQTSFTGLKNNALTNFLPAITSVMDGLTKIFAGDESGLAQINEGVSEFTENLTKALPDILKTGASIIESLASAIIDNLPEIIEAGSEVIMELVEALIENLPEIIETGLEVIVALAEGIADSLPELIPTIVDVVLQIVDSLIENVDLLIDASLALIMGLAEGLINSLPSLIEKAPEIVLSIVDAIIENAPKLLESSLELILMLGQGLVDSIPDLIASVPEVIQGLLDKFKSVKDDMKDAGKNLIDGIKQGIKDAWDSFTNWLYGKFEGIVDGVKEVFGIHSPSKVFATIGEQCIAGFEDGSDEMFSDKGMTAKISAEVTGQNRVDALLDLLEEYLPNLATNDSLSNVGISIDNRQFGRLVTGVI